MRRMAIMLGLVALVATSCGDSGDVEPTATVTRTETETETESRPTATVTATETDSVEPDSASPRPDDPGSPPFPANTEPDDAEGSGEPVTVTAIRIARHETYDRAVFEFAGSGRPGWHAEYVDPATEQGSGRNVEVEGEATIELLIDNIVYPPGDNRHEQGLVDGAQTLREVHFGTAYEGLTQAFLGVSMRTPFRVFLTEDGNRLVVDVVHPEADTG